MEVLDETPKGFQVLRCGVRVSGSAAWEGGPHGAGPEIPPLLTCAGFNQRSVKTSVLMGDPLCGVAGGKEKRERRRVDLSVSRW